MPRRLTKRYVSVGLMGESCLSTRYPGCRVSLPRRSKSGWSKRNIVHVDRLIQTGQMTYAGLKEVEAAKADGRWAAAYDSPANATMPPEFMKQLARNTKARQFFSTLNRANLYAIAYRLQTAKRPETKIKRMKVIIEMLARGEKFH